MLELLSSLFGGAAGAGNYALGGVNAYALYQTSRVIDGMVEALPLLKDAGLEGKYFTPLGSIQYWEQVFSTIKETNRQFGISGQLAKEVEESAKIAYDTIIQYGGEMDDIMASFQAFTELYGRNVLFSGEDLENIAKLRVAFEEGFEEIFAINLMLGKSIESTSDFLDEVYETSNDFGINTRKTLQNIKNNLSAVDRLSFRRGTQALADMAINAERMRISIESALGLAEELYSPERAIELASQVQMLGGEFAKFGDPFELIFLARNEPEALQKRIAEVTKGIATLNKQTGEIDIDPFGFSQLREFAKLANLDIQELAQSARQLAREEFVSNLFSFDVKSRKDFDEVLSKISGLAQFREGEWQVRVADQFKSIVEINDQDIQKLSAIDEDEEDRYRSLIESNRTLEDSVRILTNVILRNLVGSELYRFADRDLKGLIQDIDDKVINQSGFNLMKSFFNEMQEQTYKIVGSELNSLLEGDFNALGEQIQDNIFNPIDDLRQLNTGVIERMGDQADNFEDFFQKFKDYLDSATTLYNRINNTLSSLSSSLSSITNIFTSASSIFAPNPSSSNFLGFQLTGKGILGLFNSNTTPAPNNNSTSLSKFGGNSTNNKLSLNGNINNNFGGTIRLELDGEGKNIILNNPDFKKNLMSMTEKLINQKIEERLTKAKQDSNNNFNLLENIG